MPEYLKPGQRPELGHGEVISGDKLRAGDQILGARTGKSGSWTWWDSNYILDREPDISDDGMFIILYLPNPRGNVVGYDYPSYNEYLVIRPNEVRVPASVDLSAYPHKCPRCGSPAYINFFDVVDCKSKCV